LTSPYDAPSAILALIIILEKFNLIELSQKHTRKFSLTNIMFQQALMAQKPEKPVVPLSFEKEN
jgi:hypothetical protein